MHNELCRYVLAGVTVMKSLRGGVGAGVCLPRGSIGALDIAGEACGIHQRGVLEPHPQFSAQLGKAGKIAAERDSGADEGVVRFGREFDEIELVQLT